MTNKSDWQDANRELLEQQRQKLGDPPTAEELLAYRNGELSESEAERIRDLLVAYPDLARLYATPFPEEGDPVAEEQLRNGWTTLQRRLGNRKDPTARADAEAQRGRVLFRRYAPTTIAAMLALVFFGLYVHAESRARYYAEQGKLPRILGAPQQLDPGGRRGPDSSTMLRKDGEAYFLEPRLMNQVRHPHYRVDLQDSRGTVLWTNNSARPDDDDAFQIVVPHAFLQPGEEYALKIFGLDGKASTEVGEYGLAVPAE